eukprot:SAG31_NODE_2384_length_5820_cov_7.105732_4_plen_174_part_00
MQTPAGGTYSRRKPGSAAALVQPSGNADRSQSPPLQNNLLWREASIGRLLSGPWQQTKSAPATRRPPGAPARAAHSGQLNGRRRRRRRRTAFSARTEQHSVGLLWRDAASPALALPLTTLACREIAPPRTDESSFARPSKRTAIGLLSLERLRRAVTPARWYRGSWRSSVWPG